MYEIIDGNSVSVPWLNEKKELLGKRAFMCSGESFDKVEYGEVKEM